MLGCVVTRHASSKHASGTSKVVASVLQDSCELMFCHHADALPDALCLASALCAVLATCCPSKRLARLAVRPTNKHRTAHVTCDAMLAPCCLPAVQELNSLHRTRSSAVAAFVA